MFNPQVDISVCFIMHWLCTVGVGVSLFDCCFRLLAVQFDCFTGQRRIWRVHWYKYINCMKSIHTYLNRLYYPVAVRAKTSRKLTSVVWSMGDRLFQHRKYPVWPQEGSKLISPILYINILGRRREAFSMGSFSFYSSAVHLFINATLVW